MSKNPYSIFTVEHYKRIDEIAGILYMNERSRIFRLDYYANSCFDKWSGVFGLAFSRIFMEHFLYRSDPGIIGGPFEEAANVLNNFTYTKALLGFHPDKGITIAILYRLPVNILRLLIVFPFALADCYFHFLGVDLREEYPLVSKFFIGLHLLAKVVYLALRTAFSSDHSYYQARRISPLLAVLSIVCTIVTQSILVSPIWPLLTIGAIGLVGAINSSAGSAAKAALTKFGALVAAKMTIPYAGYVSNKILKATTLAIGDGIRGFGSFIGNLLTFKMLAGYGINEAKRCPQPKAAESELFDSSHSQISDTLSSPQRWRTIDTGSQNSPDILSPRSSSITSVASSSTSFFTPLSREVPPLSPCAETKSDESYVGDTVTL